MKLLATLLLFVPIAALATSYRWVDEQGAVHYTQSPPAGRAYTTIGPAPPPSASPNQDALNQSLSKGLEEEPKRREDAAKAQQEQAAKGERCKKNKEALSYFEANPPVRLMTQDAQGNYSRMSEEQYNQQRATAQKAVSESCT